MTDTYDSTMDRARNNQADATSGMAHFTYDGVRYTCLVPAGTGRPIWKAYGRRISHREAQAAAAALDRDKEQKAQP